MGYWGLLLFRHFVAALASVYNLRGCTSKSFPPGLTFLIPNVCLTCGVFYTNTAVMEINVVHEERQGV